MRQARDRKTPRQKAGFLLVATLLLAAWALGPPWVWAGEPIGGFSRKPVVSWRPLTRAELARIEAWNRSHPEAAISPKEANSLDLHFLKHAAGGREFVVWGLLGPRARFSSPEDYEQAARHLASSRADGRRIRRFRRRDGATVTVDVSSGGVVIVAPDGRIKTFFNAAASCFGREPAVRCRTSPGRALGWIRRRLAQGRLAEIDYTTDPLAQPQPLAPTPSSSLPAKPIAPRN